MFFLRTFAAWVFDQEILSKCILVLGLHLPLFLQEHNQCFQKDIRSIYIGKYKSENPRRDEVGRDLWSSSAPSPLLKQGHLEQVDQDRVQMAFEYLQG